MFAGNPIISTNFNLPALPKTAYTVKAAAEGKAIYHDALAALPKVHRALKVEGWALKKMDGCKMTTVYFCLFSIYTLYITIYIYIKCLYIYILSVYIYIIYTISLS